MKKKHIFHGGATEDISMAADMADTPNRSVSVAPATGDTSERTSTGSGAGLDALLGERIRHMRKTRGLSLKELAERSTISIGSLSQIERGLSSPSVRVLSSLADTLQIPVGSLFEDSGTPATDESEVVVRANQRKQLQFWRTGMTKELLTPVMCGRGLEMFVITIAPEGTTGSQTYSHDGLDAGFVLEGLLALHVDGKEYLLRGGDSFGFSSQLPHSFYNPSDKLTRVIWINVHAIPGEYYDSGNESE